MTDSRMPYMPPDPYGPDYRTYQLAAALQDVLALPDDVLASDWMRLQLQLVASVITARLDRIKQRNGDGEL